MRCKSVAQWQLLPLQPHSAGTTGATALLGKKGGARQKGTYLFWVPASVGGGGPKGRKKKLLHQIREVTVRFSPFTTLLLATTFIIHVIRFPLYCLPNNLRRLISEIQRVDCDTADAANRIYCRIHHPPTLPNSTKAHIISWRKSRPRSLRDVMTQALSNTHIRPPNMPR